MTTPKSHTGIHPYIADLPIFEDKVKEFAETMDDVGLIHAITLDSDGKIIGGRHRLAACEIAGIEPHYEVWEGDPLAFMLHDNDARKHQTTGQLAAEKAITLAKAGWREDGRWKRGTTSYLKILNSEKKSAGVMLSSAGLILDILGEEALQAVATGEVPFSEMQEKATAEKNAREAEEQRRIAEARDEQAREDKAGRYFDNHPEAQAWLNAKPQGAFDTMRGAYAAYMEHDREARRIEAEKRQREENERRELEEMDQREAKKITSWIAFLPSAIELKTWPRREQVLDLLDKDTREKFLHAETTILKGAEL